MGRGLSADSRPLFVQRTRAGAELARAGNPRPAQQTQVQRMPGGCLPGSVWGQSARLASGFVPSPAGP